MISKVLGFSLIVVGDMVLVISLAADAMGLGTAPGATGYRQIVGACLGILIQLVGLVVMQLESKKKFGV
ncbi:MAG TPA: hypothetical protein VMJ64_03485 [Anaerolineales bacterium]|nr:hypothetical protein [Anaerolineales bacterium]